MWCPSCRTEYREGSTRCADCGAELVDELPAPVARIRDLERGHDRVDGPFLPDDDTVELMTTNDAEAEVTAAHLRSAGIPAVAFGVSAYTGYGAAFARSQGSRVMVRRGDLDAARALVIDLEQEAPAEPRVRRRAPKAAWALVVLFFAPMFFTPWTWMALVVAGAIAAVIAAIRFVSIRR